MTPKTPKVAPQICPKCGYDQSGMIETWTDRCPVEGRCTECGLNFAWAIVMDPSREELYWYSEHGRSLKASLGRTPRTFLKLLMPHRFWREVTVLVDIRLRSLGVWIAALFLFTHLLASIPVAIGSWRASDGWQYLSFAQYIKIQGVLGAFRFVFNGVFAEMAYLEFDRAGRLVFSFGSQYYSGLDGGWIVPLSNIGMIAVWVVVLLVVPTTRSIAKVRCAHIVRAMMLSILTVVLVYELFRMTLATLLIFSGRSSLGEAAYLGFYLSVSIWLLLFWGTAVRIGWRIRPSWLLIVLGTIASALGGFAAMLMPVYFM